MKSEVIIYTQLNRPKTMPCPSGSHFLNKYIEQIEEGIKTLVRDGETDVWALIQSHAEECNIQNIIKRATLGDMSGFRQGDPTYMDSTTLPKNLMDAQNLVLRMKQEFEKMPLEVRKEFNYSAEEYVNEMGTPEFNEKMKPYNEKIAKISEEKSHKEYLQKVKDGAKLNYDIRKEEEMLANGLGGKE